MNQKANTSPTIGLDVGERRIGVAVADASGRIAMPHQTLEGELSEAIDRIGRLVAARQTETIVVGWPKTLQNRRGRSTEFVDHFIDSLVDSIEIDVSVVRWDERFSTKEAETVFVEHDVSRAPRRAAIDRVAASRILQSYLDANH